MSRAVLQRVGQHVVPAVLAPAAAESAAATGEASGSCFCGAVRYTFALPSLFAGHCHCSMCRRIHGAAYVTWVGVSTESLAISVRTPAHAAPPHCQQGQRQAVTDPRALPPQGEENLTTMASSEHGNRRFCKLCSSSLFCDATTHLTLTDVTFASLHGQIDREPSAHWYSSDRAGWASVGDDDLPWSETAAAAAPGVQLGGELAGKKIE